MTLSQIVANQDAAEAEYFAAAKEAAARGAAIRVTPLDIAGLAETRRADPDLALRIAEQSAAQTDGAMK